MRFVGIFCLALCALALHPASAATPAKSSGKASGKASAKASDALAATIVQYLAANSDTGPGDLLVSSELQDLADYLRETRGRAKVHLPRLLKLVPTDKSTLSQIYHGPGGDALRQAAGMLGSYAPFDRLTSTAAGRKQLEEAAEVASPDAFTRLVDVQERTDRKPTYLNHKIYTVEDLIRRYTQMSKNASRKH